MILVAMRWQLKRNHNRCSAPDKVALWTKMYTLSGSTYAQEGPIVEDGLSNDATCRRKDVARYVNHTYDAKNRGTLYPTDP